MMTNLRAIALFSISYLAAARSPVYFSKAPRPHLALSRSVDRHRPCAQGRLAQLIGELRGGISTDDAEEEDESSPRDAASGDDSGDADAQSAVNAGDFEGESTMFRRLQNAVQRTPPITQAFMGASIGLTIASFALNSNRWPTWLLLDWSKVLRGQVGYLSPRQEANKITLCPPCCKVWRVLTTFLYFGPLDLSYALTVQFVWQYMSQLEKVHHKEPEQVLAVSAFLYLPS